MNNHCNNCGKTGHLFHQCKLPITSYGVIVYRISEKGIQFLMIRRKDSFGYIDFIRGKYIPYNIEQIQNCVNEMSVMEKERILNEPFDVLWKNMWGNVNMNQFRAEEYMSYKKYNKLINGIVIYNNHNNHNNDFNASDISGNNNENNSNIQKITLEHLVCNSNTSWEETEWEFPKGRRNHMEKDLDCALREFEEETGYSKKDVTIVENIIPFEEIFIGSNHKSYKHKYFVAFMQKNIPQYDMQNYQKTEVSKLEWKTIEECMNCIRPYNLEKKKLIQNVHKMLEEYIVF